MKKIFFLFLLSHNVFAQKQDTTLILKTTPSYIFDFDNSFTIGAEYFLKRHFSVQSEFGYGNTNQNLLIPIGNESLESQKPYRGFDVFRGKLETRFYVKTDNRPPNGFYYAVEVFYKFVGKKDYFRVSRDAINFIPEYWEYVLGVKTRQVWGSHVKIGRQFYIFDSDTEKRKRWLMDIYLGIGFRNINNYLKYDDKRENDRLDRTRNDFGKIFNDNGKQNIISGTLGFKLGYLLR